MKINDVYEVQALCEKRSKLDLQLTQITDDAGRYLGVTINGQYQDDVFINAVKPMVLSELRLRIHRIDCRLKELGVEIEETPDPAQPPLPLETEGPSIGRPIEHHQV